MPTPELFCVGDPDSLTVRLSTAANNAQHDEIRIESGTYPGGFFYQSIDGMNLILSGGWDAGCQNQTRDPRLTVLDGTSSQRVLKFIPGVSATSLTVYNLSIMNGFASGMGVGNNRGGGLDYSTSVGSTGDLTIAHTIFAFNESAEFGGGLRGGSDGGVVRIENSLFYENTAAINGGASLTGNNGAVYVTNNTIADNHATDTVNPVGGIRIGGSSTHFVENNIFWGNDMIDFWIQTSVTLRNNNIGTQQGGPPIVDENNISADPMMSSGDDYALFLSSPSINAGRNDPVGGLPDGDLFGGDRIFGVIADQGVHETIDILFADSLEN